MGASLNCILDGVLFDQAAGTGGMLTTAYNYIKKQNETADIRLFAQEVNPESYAECLAEMLIKGQDETFIKRVDTFKEDCFPDIKMRFVLEIPCSDLRVRLLSLPCISSQIRTRTAC